MSLSVSRQVLKIVFGVAVVVCCTMYAIIRHPQYVFSVESYFTSPMSSSDLAILQQTLVVLSDVLERINATYFMTSGTLIGSYRHHGRIPWDDDVDLIVSQVDRDRLRESLSALEPEYVLFKLQNRNHPSDRMLWKFFSSAARFVPLKSYRWPFVDIMFFDEDDQFVWNVTPWFPDERWPRSTVFPLVRRPFDGLWLPAPCDTAAVLAVNFNVSECASRPTTHFYDRALMSSVVVPCSNLTKFVPFVLRRTSHVNPANSSASGEGTSRERVDTRDDVIESLMLESRTLHTLSVQSGCQSDIK